MIKQLENQLKSVRDATKREQPLIHCITNPISIHGCANMILAVGARPMMAEHPLEVEEITKTAGALMLNLGNITDVRIESMKRSAQTAAKEGIPVLLDLVGVSCSKIRMKLAMELIEKGKIQPFHGTGIDAGVEDAMTGDNEEERKEIFRKVSKRTGSVLLATGARDLLVDQERCLILENGVPELSGITGTGCMVGALTAAFLPGCEDNIAKEMTDSIEAGVWSGVEMELNGRSGNYLAAAVLGTALMGIAGEEAEKISRGPGSFQVNLLDEIYGLSDRQLLDLLKIEMY